MSRFRLWHSLRQRLGRPRDSAYDDLSVFQPTLVTDWRGVSTPPAADSDSVWAMPSAPGIGATAETEPRAGLSAQALRLAALEAGGPGTRAARHGGDTGGRSRADTRDGRGGRTVPAFEEDSLLDIIDDAPPVAPRSAAVSRGESRPASTVEARAPISTPVGAPVDARASAARTSASTHTSTSTHAPAATSRPREAQAMAGRPSPLPTALSPDAPVETPAPAAWAAARAGRDQRPSTGSPSAGTAIEPLGAVPPGDGADAGPAATPGWGRPLTARAQAPDSRAAHAGLGTERGLVSRLAANAGVTLDDGSRFGSPSSAPPHRPSATDTDTDTDTGTGTEAPPPAPFPLDAGPASGPEARARQAADHGSRPAPLGDTANALSHASLPGSDALAAAERAFGRPLRHPVSPYESREAAYRRSQRPQAIDPSPIGPEDGGRSAARGMPGRTDAGTTRSGMPAATPDVTAAQRPVPANAPPAAPTSARAERPRSRPFAREAPPPPAAGAAAFSAAGTGSAPDNDASRGRGHHASADPAAPRETETRSGPDAHGRPASATLEIITPRSRPEGPGRGPEPIAPDTTGFADSDETAKPSPMARAVPWLGPAAMALAAVGAIGWGYQQLVDNAPPPMPEPAAPLPVHRVASAPRAILREAASEAPARLTAPASEARLTGAPAALAAPATPATPAATVATVATTATTATVASAGAAAAAPAATPASAINASSPVRAALPKPAAQPLAAGSAPMPTATTTPARATTPTTTPPTTATTTSAPKSAPTLPTAAPSPSPTTTANTTANTTTSSTPTPTPPPPAPPRAIPPVAGAVPGSGTARSVPASGHIVAWQEVVVAADQPVGRLTELQAQVGQWVRRGQLLAVFAADGARAELAQAEARVAEAEAALLAAQADAQRARQVQGSGALSAQAISQMLAAEQTAKARLRAAQAGAQAQKVKLDQAQVRAPYDGLVLQRPATVGTVPAPGAELYRLLRDGRVEWRAVLPAAELAALQAGTPARLSLTDGRTLEGRVRLVEPQVDPRTRTGIVHVELPAGAPAKPGETPVLQLRPGLEARGELLPVPTGAAHPR